MQSQSKFPQNSSQKQKNNSKFHMEPQYTLNSHSKPEQKYNAEGIITPILQSHSNEKSMRIAQK